MTLKHYQNVEKLMKNSPEKVALGMGKMDDVKGIAAFLAGSVVLGAGALYGLVRKTVWCDVKTLKEDNDSTEEEE